MPRTSWNARRRRRGFTPIAAARWVIGTDSPTCASRNASACRTICCESLARAAKAMHEQVATAVPASFDVSHARSDHYRQAVTICGVHRLVDSPYAVRRRTRHALATASPAPRAKTNPQTAMTMDAPGFMRDLLRAERRVEHDLVV